MDQWKLVWPTILDDLKKRRFIQVGLFAWVLLLLLAVTSPAFVMRWMGGKAWRRLHWAGVCGGRGRMHPLLVAGEEGRSGADAIYACVGHSAAGTSGVGLDEAEACARCACPGSCGRGLIGH